MLANYCDIELGSKIYFMLDIMQVNVKKNRKSRLLGHVNFDGQNHRFVKKVIKTDLFPDLDITFRVLDII